MNFFSQSSGLENAGRSGKAILLAFTAFLTSCTHAPKQDQLKEFLQKDPTIEHLKDADLAKVDSVYALLTDTNFLHEVMINIVPHEGDTSWNKVSERTDGVTEERFAFKNLSIWQTKDKKGLEIHQSSNNTLDVKNNVTGAAIYSSNTGDITNEYNLTDEGYIAFTQKDVSAFVGEKGGAVEGGHVYQKYVVVDPKSGVIIDAWVDDGGWPVHRLMYSIDAKGTIEGDREVAKRGSEIVVVFSDLLLKTSKEIKESK